MPNPDSEARPAAAAAAGATRVADFVADRYRRACALELQALKPGNVHRFADGHGMRLADFEASALASAPALACPGAGVGARVRGAIEATGRAVGCNTNLGIVLLCAPIALAVERLGGAPVARAGLAQATRAVLAALDADDARGVFGAIAAAAPGGLGAVPANDVRAEARVGLLVAMGEAAHRDRIARQYVSGMEDIFGFALDLLRRGDRAGIAGQHPGIPDPAAVARLYLDLLATWPDSHIVRKFGDTVAQHVTAEAVALRAAFPDGPRTAAATAAYLDWDSSLKSRKINPGTTADLTVATVFVCLLTDG